MPTQQSKWNPEASRGETASQDLMASEDWEKQARPGSPTLAHILLPALGTHTKESKESKSTLEPASKQTVVTLPQYCYVLKIHRFSQ